MATRVAEEAADAVGEALEENESQGVDAIGEDAAEENAAEEEG